ncbi:hypothetical protein [Streptomyces sp. NPDC054834]
MPGFAGWYYTVTARDHVGYESWLERDRLILLDRDPQVRAISSQPFWLHWHDGRRHRRHAPDHFVRLAAGQPGSWTSAPRRTWIGGHERPSRRPALVLTQVLPAVPRLARDAIRFARSSS